ncbi:hypothetical protein BKA70DRAFT_1439356 [Coprinopsis sp. MPI-PUGE-AT-0042]|nr:hypothetical protein BKA70DRAFT_1439356 [Coprinopsis sp. MPI-PUGE-AT-0042]
MLARFIAEEACGDNANAIPTVDLVNLGKMEALEASLAGCTYVNDQPANDLEELEGAMVSTDELQKVEKETKVLCQTISEHEHEIAAQTTKINELEQAVFDLSSEIAGGRHIPPKTQNGALIEQLKELEESGVSCNPASQRSLS